MNHTLYNQSFRTFQARKAARFTRNILLVTAAEVVAIILLALIH